MFSVKINEEYYNQNTENSQFKLTLFEKNDDNGVREQWFRVENLSDFPLKIQDIVSLSVPVSDETEIHYFENRWGYEFDPKRETLSKPFEMKSELGRSSAQFQTLFYLESSCEVKLFQLGWSGNWRVWTEANCEQARLNIGLEEDFATSVNAKEAFESFPVYFSVATDLNKAGTYLSRYGENHVFPKNPYEDVPGVSWNHWWAYEDKQINEETFLANLECASALGIDTMVLDAGWFGLYGDDWFEERGDWEHVNKSKFPSGLRFLSNVVHEKDMKFGLWCEIEALGKSARLRSKEPDFAAMCGDEDLDYVCFGNESATEWAFTTLSRLISDYNCDWIKLDFNLDPKSGCNSKVHGHDEFDGLYTHYKGLYRLLRDLRQKFPHVLFENCASGGLRTDWGMLKETHLQFLSDPDYASHQLQMFWGASLSIPPLRCLHFAWSDTLPYEPFPPKKWNECSEEEIRAYLRVAGMHRFGLSHRLTEWSERTMTIVAEGIREYKEKIFPRLANAQVYRLSSQHERKNVGVDVFQFIQSNQNMMLFLFDFDRQGTDGFKTAQPLYEIDENSYYECEWLSAKKKGIITGGQLLSKQWSQHLGMNISEIIIIKRIDD